MYVIEPRAEAHTTLRAPYNIISDGIIIGSNIERHKFQLNGMGGELDNAMHTIKLIEAELSELQKEIDDLKVEIEDQRAKFAWIDGVELRLNNFRCSIEGRKNFFSRAADEG
jgi:chromosome segregation ATPase